ncbi:MAG: protein-glutamine glutaminase family protein, partial [bacterium]
MCAAQMIFDIMASQKDIAFGYPCDGCYARAHIMVQRMQQLGVEPEKVWTFPGSPTDPLTVNTSNTPSGVVKWNGYHVAPTIPVVQTDGSIKNM